MCSPEVKYDIKKIFYFKYCLQNKYVSFPDSLNIQDSYDLCNYFGGYLAISKEKANYDEVKNALKKRFFIKSEKIHEAMKQIQTRAAWLRFTDKGQL